MTCFDESVISVINHNFTQNYDRVAIVDMKRIYTYQQLDRYSDFMASLFSKRNDGPVAFLLPDNSALIISILAAIKIKRTFVPVDCNWPDERIEQILKSSGATTLVTDQKYPTVQFQHEMIQIDENKWQEGAGLYDIHHENSDMYIIYTSGTTGKPKGVVVQYSNIFNYYQWLCQHYSRDDRTMLLSSLAYDLSYTSLFAMLFCGTRIYVDSRECYLDMVYLGNYLLRNNINSIKLTPSFFRQVVLHMENFSKVNMSQIILGGEPVNPSDIQLFMKLCPDTKFINHYGPTETTIGVITQNIDSGTIDGFLRDPTIGKPISGVKIRIVNQDNQDVPLGVTGELIIGGASVARGYYRDDVLTKKSFFYESGLWWYRTGDLVRVNQQKHICIIGRSDTQIKLHGYRIELMEIKAMLERMEGVIQAHIEIVEENRKRKIVACIVRKQMDGFGAIQYQKELAKQLPYYMVPERFEEFEYFPLTLNGKIDRNELCQMIRKRGDFYIDLIPPRDEKDVQMQAYWQKVLNIESVGIESNFFQLGGNSFKAVQLSSLLKNPAVSSREIFKYPTIKQLCNYMSHMESESLPKMQGTEYVPKMDYEKFPTMKKIQIDPFNDVLYRNCLYNALFAVLIYYGIDINHILSNEIPIFASSDGFLNIGYMQELDLIQLLDKQNVNVEVYQKTEKLMNCIANAINENKFVILHVDCFYESIRNDMYQVAHWPHFLLVAGYNKDTQMVTVLEHSDVYSLDYQLKEISIIDIQNSYEGYLQNFNNDSMPTVIIISSRDKTADPIEDAFNQYKTCYQAKRADVLNGLNLLKQFRSQLSPDTINKYELLIKDILIANNGEIYKLERMNKIDCDLYEQVQTLNKKINELYGMLIKGKLNEAYLSVKAGLIESNFQMMVQLQEQVCMMFLAEI